MNARISFDGCFKGEGEEGEGEGGVVLGSFM